MKKKCVICGRSFEARSAKTLTCSFECQQEKKRRYAREFMKTHRYSCTCAECGKTFKGNRGKKYCSEECRRKHPEGRKKRSESPKEKKPITLTEIAERARKEGLSYGQYVARYM